MRRISLAISLCLGVSLPVFAGERSPCIYSGNTAKCQASGGITDSTSKFVVDSSGNITKLNNVTTNFPSSQGTANTVLTNDGSGGLTWTAPGAVVTNYGDGSDGAVTISGNTSLTRDMFYSSLTVNNGITLTTAGFKVFISGTLTNNGTIDDSGAAGGNASGTTAGTGATGLAAGTLGGSGGGASSANTASSAGNAGTAQAFSLDDSANSTGGGGAGGAGGGGGAGGSSGGTTYTPFRTLSPHLLYGANLIGGGGGGGSGGNGATLGGTRGDGGGGGAGGGVIFLWAATLTNNGTIHALGGNGGTGSNSVGTGGNGGGGGGGGGGVVFLVYNTITAGTISASGGTGGAAGANGTGTAGVAGSNGQTGRVIRYNATTNTWL